MVRLVNGSIVQLLGAGSRELGDIGHYIATLGAYFYFQLFAIRFFIVDCTLFIVLSLLPKLPKKLGRNLTEVFEDRLGSVG